MLFAALHPDKTSVYETRLMGIFGVNKSRIAALAVVYKMEFHWRVLNYISRCPSKRKERNTKRKSNKATHTQDQVQNRGCNKASYRSSRDCCSSRHTSLNYSAFARRQPWVAHINIIQSICTLVSGWLCEVAVPGVDFPLNQASACLVTD